MRVLLVEDSLELARWLAKALGHSGYTVECLHDGLHADNMLLTQHYDVVILDLILPRIDGLEVLRRLRQRGSKVPVLVLTVRADLDDRVKGLNAGADDYLAKPFALAELEARLRALIRRSQGIGSPQVELGTLVYDSVDRMFRLGGQLLALRPREHAVLEILVLHARKAVAKELLYEKVFGLDAAANAEAIEIYIHRLRKKLEGSGVSIMTLRGLGYLIEAVDAQ